jgi:hypothetical protein
VKYAWIEEQRKHYSLDELCRMLEVSESGYRAWLDGGKSTGKRLTDAQMLVLIRAIHAEFKGSYGSPRMTRALRARGYPASNAACGAPDERERHSGQAQAAIQGNDGLEA